jgi:hypothetical protein
MKADIRHQKFSTITMQNLQTSLQNLQYNIVLEPNEWMRIFICSQ